MGIKILEFTPECYEEAYALWQHCDGIGLSDADEWEPMTAFLLKNPGLNFIARVDGSLAGTCLSGSDGRRGYLYHLAVEPTLRRRGIGKMLVERTLEALAEQEIHKCHIMVFGKNESGLAFWKSGGWVARPEIVLMSHNVGFEERRGAC